MRRVRLTHEAVVALCADAYSAGVIWRMRGAAPKSVLQHMLRCSVVATQAVRVW